MEAIKLQLCTTISLTVIFFVAFGFLNKCNIPVKVQSADFSKAAESGSAFSSSEASIAEKTLAYKLDFFNFVPTALGFLGWLLFVMFAGIGLIALPLDLMMEFFYQPQIVGSTYSSDLPENWLNAKSLFVSELKNFSNTLKLSRTKKKTSYLTKKQASSKNGEKVETTKKTSTV